MEQDKIRVPRKGELVMIRGEKQVFTVLQVSKHSQFASLKSLDGKTVRPLVSWEFLRFPKEAS
jgi:hypothetical protein